MVGDWGITNHFNMDSEIGVFIVIEVWNGHWDVWMTVSKRIIKFAK